jgi:hypothetical protein
MTDNQVTSITDNDDDQTALSFDRPFVLSMGPQRAGTTWVDRYLRFRGDVCMPNGVKEVFFFDRHFERGAQFYKDHFEPEDDHKFLMEISTTSFDHPDAPQRVKDLLGPNIKMICPLRHPVARSYSLYQHFMRYGIVHGSLEQAAGEIPQIISSSRYGEHLQRWFDVFGRDNITILYQEDLEADQERVVRDMCAALDLDHVAPADDVARRLNVATPSRYPRIAKFFQNLADWFRSNGLYVVVNLGKAIGLKRLIFGKERPEAQRFGIPQADLQFLQKRLVPEIEKLEALLGHDIPQWHDGEV